VMPSSNRASKRASNGNNRFATAALYGRAIEGRRGLNPAAFTLSPIKNLSRGQETCKKTSN
jgi:hypothetical protein